MATVLWAEPPQARRRRRKFWAPKGPFPKKSSSAHQNASGGSAVVAHSIGRSWPDGLLPPDAPAAPAASAAVPPCQQPCCRAFCTHDGSAAARQLVRRVGQGARRALAVFMMRARRVSAAVRRGAAAYGVAFRAFEEARTHGCLRTKSGGERFEGGFLYKILRRPQWHHPLSTPHYLYHTFPKLTYSKGSQHHHAYPRRNPR